MIPFAILSGTIIYRNEKSLEIRVLDLSVDGFTFRLSGRDEPTAENPVERIRLHFYEQSKAPLWLNAPADFTLCLEERQDFYAIYRVYVENREYVKLAQGLMKRYLTYIDWKLSGDDVAMSHELVGYPKDQEDVFPADFDTLRRKQLFGREPDELWKQQIRSTEEIGVVLDSDFNCEDIILPLGIEQDMITHAYIGNQFCSHRFPKDEVLKSQIEWARKAGMTSVVCFAPISQGRMAEVEEILQKLIQYEVRELVVNDWGLARLISKEYKGQFGLIMGVLLCKRKKDPRMGYKPEAIEVAVRGNEAFYQKISEMGFVAVSGESCGYSYELPPMPVDYYLPYYQINTSGHCTLYAMCKNGRRDAQEPVEECPGYCQQQDVLYPEHLGMVGRYNSLFGFDERILFDGEYATCAISQGVRRLIMQTL